MYIISPIGFDNKTKSLCYVCLIAGQPLGSLVAMFRRYFVLLLCSNAFDESRLFVISAECTDSVDDLIDLLQGLTVHEPVEFLEVGFDGFIIETTGFVIGIEQHLQDAVCIIGIVWLQGIQL